MLTKVNPHIWDYLFNQSDKPLEVAGEMVGIECSYHNADDNAQCKEKWEKTVP